MYICPSVSMQQLENRQMDFHEFWYLCILLKFVDTFHFLLRSENKTVSLHKHLHAFLHAKVIWWGILIQEIPQPSSLHPQPLFKSHFNIITTLIIGTFAVVVSIKSLFLQIFFYVVLLQHPRKTVVQETV
jgi:hypothetical protein